MNDAFIVILMSSICFIYSGAVEVYKAGASGKPGWRETSEMRDRSIVPTPSPEDVAKDNRRSRIPVSMVTSYRSRSSAIPRPSQEDILADYRRRSKILIPLASKFRKRFQVPVSLEERAMDGVNFKTQTRRATNRHSSVQKKNLIDRIFFTIPFGAQFPIYFASKSKKGANKKSKVAAPVSNLVPRNRAPFKLQTWGLPINYQALNNKRLIPFMENQAIRRQQIIPTGDEYASLGYNRGYSRPRSFITSRLLSNRNIIPYPSYRNQANTVPYRLRASLNRRKRTSGSESSKKNISKDLEPDRKALITKDRQGMDNDNLNNSKTSDWPQSAVDKEIENILTKLLIVI